MTDRQVVAKALVLVKQYNDAEGLGVQEAIETAAETLEAEGDLGDFTYLGLVDNLRIKLSQE